MNVITREGQIVTKLDGSQFVGYFRHKPLQILAITEDRRPRRVFILLDASGSMEPTHKFTFDLADELLSRLPPGTEVGFLVFAKAATGSLALTTDRETIRQQLQNLRDDQQLQKKLKGTTALLSAIHESLASFGNPQDGDALYIISDGRDNASNLDWHKLNEEVLQQRVRVFAMQPKLVEDGGPVPDEASNDLEDIVTSTGGLAIVLPLLGRVGHSRLSLSPPLRDPTGKPTEVATRLDLQVRLITSLSKIVVQLPEPPGKALGWELRFSEPKASKDLILIYPHTLPPCLASASSN
jgi:hypothetical protein